MTNNASWHSVTTVRLLLTGLVLTLCTSLSPCNVPTTAPVVALKALNKGVDPDPPARMRDEQPPLPNFAV